MAEPPGGRAHLEGLFRDRLALVHAAAAAKTSAAQVPAPARVEAVIANVRSAAREASLDEEAMAAAYRTIVGLFIAHEGAVVAARVKVESPAAATLPEVRRRVDELDRQIIGAAAKAGRDQAAAALVDAARSVLSA